MAVNPPITIGPFSNVPAPGSPIRSDWAQQLTQAVVDQSVRRLWSNSLTALNNPGTYTTVPGSTYFPPVSYARRWTVTYQLTVDPAEAGVPKIAYVRPYINGGLQSENAFYIGATNITVWFQFCYFNPVLITSTQFMITGWRTTGGLMWWRDEGP